MSGISPKVKGGRPTKYEDWMPQEAEEYLAEGRTKRALAGYLRISEDTLYRWLKDHEAFSEAVSIGVNRYEGWYCDELHKGLYSESEYDDGRLQSTKSMNTGIASLIGRNVLGWDKKDKEEPTNNNFTFTLSYDPKNLKDKNERDNQS